MPDTPATPPSVKDAARMLVEQLPDDATWADLMYGIYVRESIDAGLAAIAAGHTFTTAEVRLKLGLPPS